MVAAFASWHESHAVAVTALTDDALVPAPCALEAYSVLTRLPAPHRAAGSLVRDFLAQNFAERIVPLSAGASSEVVTVLVERGIEGGASYDAVVALVALEAGATLLTLDQRARQTYERVGALWRLLR